MIVRRSGAALKRAVSIEYHQKDSHLYLRFPGKKRMATVPIHQREFHRGIPTAILEQPAISEQQFLKFV